MGRKTFESINEKVRPLPGRLNVVISRSEETQKQIERDYKMYNEHTNTGILVSDSLPVGIMTAEVEGRAKWDNSELFIIGGEAIYKEAIESELVDKMYLTYIDQEIEGDTFFPEFNKKEWSHKLIGGPSEHKGLTYTFWEYIAPWAPKLHVEHSE
jgi:dihydrofolate reductase